MALEPRPKRWLTGLPDMPLAWPLAIAGVLALQIVLTVLHRPYADEWQAIFIAVQTPSLGSLLENLRYETHPPGWYLFLRAIAAVTGGYWALTGASLICGMFAQGALLLRAPWPRWMRLALALSAPILIEFTAVSRGHTLGLALFVAVLALWHRPRLVWLPIALLPSIDFLYGVSSLAFIAWRWQDRALWWPGLAAWLAISLISAWSIVPAEDYVPVYGASGGTPFAFFMALVRLSVVVFPMQGNLGEYWWSAGPPAPLMLTLWALLIPILWVLAGRRWLDMAILFGTAALLFGFSALLYPLQNRHVWILSLLMVAVMWRRGEAGEVPAPIIRLWLVLGALAGLYSAWFNLAQPSERAPEIAAFIEREGLADEYWIAVPEMAGLGVAANSGIAFEKPGGNCMQQFIRWDAVLGERKLAGFEPWLAEKAATGKRFYVLSNDPLTRVPNLAELAHYPAQLDGKQHWLYVVNPASPERATKLPDCLPELRPFR